MRGRTYLFVTLILALGSKRSEARSQKLIRCLGLFASLFLLLASANVASGQSFPKPNGLVNDFASLLDAPTREAIDTLLKGVEHDTTAEISLVTVTTLDGMPVEEYANKLFKAWGIGKKQVDNGVLVLVSTGDRTMKIEVGYGLEGILPDGLAGDIIRNQFTPRFKENDYPGGIRAGLERLATIVRANHVLTPEERKAIDAADDPPLWVLLGFFGIFITIGSLALGAGAQGRAVAPLLFGLLFAGGGFLISLVLAPLSTILVQVPLSIAMMVIGYRVGADKLWRDRVKTGGWPTGGGSGSSGSSGSGYSSGSSFGGGSSGGGGASGKW